MKQTNENAIIEALTRLEEKVDNLATIVNNNNQSRLDSETVAVLTAAAYNVFGRAIAIRNIRLTNPNANGSKYKRHYNVVAM